MRVVIWLRIGLEARKVPEMGDVSADIRQTSIGGAWAGTALELNATPQAENVAM